MSLLLFFLLLTHIFFGLFVLYTVTSAPPKKFIFRGTLGDHLCTLTIFLSLLGPIIMYNYNPAYTILTTAFCISVLIIIKVYSVKTEHQYRKPSLFQLLDQTDMESEGNKQDKDETS
jgi:hypothetical protein